MYRSLTIVTIALGLFAQSASSQDTVIYIELVDINARIGDTALIPILITSSRDSIAGFSIPLVVDQPDLIEFHDDRVLDSTSTLTEDWEILFGNAQSPTAVTIAGLADGNPPDGLPRPLAPVQSSQTLIYLVGFFPCHIDFLGDYDAQVILNGSADFSDKNGQLMVPVSVHPANISVQPPMRGDVDQSGASDVADVVATIDCAFRGKCFGCGPLLADIDCSGAVDVVDVVDQIDYIFRGGVAPNCF